MCFTVTVTVRTSGSSIRISSVALDSVVETGIDFTVMRVLLFKVVLCSGFLCWAFTVEKINWKIKIEVILSKHNHIIKGNLV